MPTSCDHTMMGETTTGELRTQIAAKIQSGQLPCAGEQKLFAGFGDNETCDGCGKPVHSGEVLYEIELTSEQGDPSVLLMHRACFKLWSEESHQRRLEIDAIVSNVG